MSQITDEIWVGSYAEACDEQFLKDRTINHILCCAEEFAVRAGFPYSDHRTGYKVSLKDDFADEKTMGLFLDGATKLNEWVSSGKLTMVHCFAGISRSVSIVITYLMIYKGWSFNTAMNHLKHCRQKSNPHPSYIPILLEIESKRPPPPLRYPA